MTQKQTSHKVQSSWSLKFMHSLPGSPTPLPPYREFDSPVTGTVSSAPSLAVPIPRRTRLRRLLTLCAGISLCFIFFTATFFYGDLRSRLPSAADMGFHTNERIEHSSSERLFKGPPTPKLRDNLKDDVKYITSFLSAGWTNDVIALVHQIYLAYLTERIPIMVPFAPTHLPKDAGFIPFSDVFDLPQLSAALQMPILEWQDLKDINSTEVDTLGCWSAWMAGGHDVTQPRDTPVSAHLNLDISYTPVPYEFKAYGEGDYHILFNRLMQLSFPSGRAEALSQYSAIPAPASGAALEPDEHLMCFDFLYYLSVDKAFEWEIDWSPEWRLVGKHMKWAPKVAQLATEYLNRHFGTPLDGPVPPFISVHLRRGDFAHTCDKEDVESCFPSLDEVSDRVRDIQDELVNRHGLRTNRVLIASDERNPEWWTKIRERGWTWINHVTLQTDEQYGKWYTPILDAAFLSMSSGMVGTDSSTYSLISERRVQDWMQGPTNRLFRNGS